MFHMLFGKRQFSGFLSRGSTQNVNRHLIHHAPVANEAVPCKEDNKSNTGKRLPAGWGVTMFHLLSAYLTPYKVHWKPISINLMSHFHSALANLGPSCNFIHSIQILQGLLQCLCWHEACSTDPSAAKFDTQPPALFYIGTPHLLKKLYCGFEEWKPFLFFHQFIIRSENFRQKALFLLCLMMK